jgi:hypothetical protein
MRNQLNRLFAFGCIALFGCGTVRAVAERNVDNAASASLAGATYGSSSPGVDMSRGANEDEHWLQTDDFFIADRPYESGYLNVHLAKMRTAASASTKSEALFFRLHDSKEVWATTYWKTRPATNADIQVGALAICFDGNNHDRVYRAPQDKHAARTSPWFMGRVTDTSDLYKGYVMVANYNCAPNALRVPMR